MGHGSSVTYKVQSFRRHLPRCRRPIDGDDFGMGDGTLGGFAQVVRTCNNLAVVHHDGSMAFRLSLVPDMLLR
jgi:hypothetical protein